MGRSTRENNLKNHEPSFIFMFRLFQLSGKWLFLMQKKSEEKNELCYWKDPQAKRKTDIFELTFLLCHKGLLFLMEKDLSWKMLCRKAQCMVHFAFWAMFTNISSGKFQYFIFTHSTYNVSASAPRLISHVHLKENTWHPEPVQYLSMQNIALFSPNPWIAQMCTDVCTGLHMGINRLHFDELHGSNKKHIILTKTWWVFLNSCLNMVTGP